MDRAAAKVGKLSAWTEKQKGREALRWTEQQGGKLHKWTEPGVEVGELHLYADRAAAEREDALRVDRTPAEGGGDLQYSQNRGGGRGVLFPADRTVTDTGDINICVDRTAANGGELCSAFRLYRDDSQWFSLSNSALSYSVHLYED
jgi:hypothetical protein